MNKKISVAGTGCALADYLYTGVRFNAPVFLKYLSHQDGDGGLAPGKLVFTEELERFSGVPYPEISKELTGGEVPSTINIGGPGLVSLINASQLLPGDEFEVRFYGGTGRDQTADFIEDLVRKTPLNIDHYHRISDKRTPFTDVLSDPTFDNNHGERTFVNNIGAAWDYTPELLGDDFFDANIVCFGGTALVPQIHDNLTLLLIRAKEKGCLTVVNTVFDFRNEKRNPGQPWPLVESQENYRLIDLLIMDCEESLKISGKKSIEEAARYFVSLDIATLVITNGAQEFYVFSNGKLFEKWELQKLPVSQRVSHDFINNPASKGDTTGCGDNFAGGIIASLARQLKTGEAGRLNLTEAIAWGVASGAFACYYVGGTYIEHEEGEKNKIVEIFKYQYIQQISTR